MFIITASKGGVLSFLKGQVLRRFSSVSHKPRVCVIGSGPAGFYTTQQLLKGNPSIQVDILDRLPTPFGLVRFGVAPDHPEVKNVINQFTTTASNPRVSFYGNVCVGKDISVEELRDSYHAIVFSYGCDWDRTLGIPGESLPNVLSAREVVGWYNGAPQNKDLNVDLSGTDVAVIGHGNVALDVARILLTSVDELKTTDITAHALDTLSTSKVKRLHVIGRRGPLQVAFTIKELREMTNLKNCVTMVSEKDFEGIKEIVAGFDRPRKRLTELLMKCLEPKSSGNNGRQWNIVFKRSPLEIQAVEKGLRLVLGVNQLEGPCGINQHAKLTADIVSLEVGSIIKSVGYKGVPIDKIIPFDEKKGIFINQNGRITGHKGLYCAGWIGTGPIGVILTTSADAIMLGKNIVNDIACGEVDVTQSKSGALHILKNKVPIVTFAGWKKIDKVETERGMKVGKPREKIVNIKEMLEIGAL